MFNFKKFSFLIFTIILLSSSLYATILNVPSTYSTIQDAIYYSLDADTVLVQPGVYYENINYNGKLITIGSLFLTTQDPAYISSTIIDGSSSNGSVVTFINGEDETTVLSGFTITNGSLTDGGGIKVEGSSPTLMNLIIIGNSSWRGGGIFFSNSNSFLENLTISGNVSDHSGGGIACFESDIALQNSEIKDNTDTSGGNYGHGGGIRFWESSPILENVTISGNSASKGGGIACFKSDTILENVTISDNTSSESGGGIYIFSENNSTNVVNSILWDNSPEQIYAYYDTTTVAYSNVDGGASGIINNDGTLNWLDGNIFGNPLFVNPSIGDYHLQSISPCIDAGDPSSPFDPDGTIADMGGLFFNQAPEADFTADTTVGIPPLTVNFTDLSTEGSGVIDEWYWDFGDGNTSTEQNPSNEYQDYGEFTVSLTVTNIYDFTDTMTKEEYIVVNPTGYNGPVWHVSTTGSDEYGNGSEELPFATIQHGIDVAAYSDTVLVEPGTYVEGYVLFDEKIVIVGSHFLTTGNEDFISSTIIDGNNTAGVVGFGNSTNSTVLCGFTITNGAGGNYGGGINCYLADPTLRSLIITGNSAIYQGGGIQLDNSNPVLVDVTISDNTSEFGAGINCSVSNPILRNVTITGNTASNFGGGIFCFDNSEPNLLNCIVWNNSPEEIFFYDDLAPNSITISYSDIEGGEAGIVTNSNGTVSWLDGNINLDPMFVDAGSGDYHLLFGSPCIDAGDPGLPFDPDGSITDMGAWFYDHGNPINENEIQQVEFNLSNYPNPFNPLTTIKFDLKEYEIGVLSIYNIKGQLIESHQIDAEQRTFQWDASNQASGVYLYKLQTESSTVNRKMLLLK